MKSRRYHLGMEAVFNQKFVDGHISSVITIINETNFHPVYCKILASNLNFFDSLDLELSTSCNERLASFLQQYFVHTACNLYDFSNSEFLEMQQLVISIVNIQDRGEKLRLSKFMLSYQVHEMQELFFKNEIDDDRTMKLCTRHFQLINVILANLDEAFFNESEEVIPGLHEIIVHSLLNIDGCLLSYALPLFYTYLKVSENWKFLQDAFSIALNRALNHDSYVIVLFSIVSYFMDASFQIERLAIILDTEEFWIILRKCYTTDCCDQKHANHILKFLTLERCRTLDGVWDCEHASAYESWWKKYFTIAEVLEEKQTHLILPMFPQFNELLDNRVAKVDPFWVLTLLRLALEHDSRTIRGKAFFSFLKVRQNLYKNAHFFILVKLFLAAANDSALFKKLHKTGELDEFADAVIAWINGFLNHDEPVDFFQALFSGFGEVKWSPIPLYYVLDFLIRTNLSPRLDIAITEQLHDTVWKVTRSHNIFIRGAIQCSFIKFVTMICRCQAKELSTFFDFLCYFNDDECLLRGARAWCNSVAYLKFTADSRFAEILSTGLISQIECDARISEKAATSLCRNILLLHDAFGVLDEENSVGNRVKNMIASFSFALRNAYLSTRAQDNCLMLLAALYSDVRSDFKVENSTASSPSIMVAIEENSLSIFSYIIQRMMRSENNVELLDWYELCLRKFDGCVKNFLKQLRASSLLNEWWNHSVFNFQSREEQSAYCCSKIVLWIYKMLHENSRLFRIININAVRIVVENFILHRKFSSPNMNSIIASNYSRTMWNIFELYLRFESSKCFNHFEFTIILEFILNAFDWIRKENLSLVIKCSKHLLFHQNALEHEEMVSQLMDDSWKRIEEIHSTPFYSDCLKNWIQTFFHLSLLRVPVFQIKIKHYVTKLSQMVGENGGQSFRYIIFVLDEFDNVEDLFHIFPESCACLIDMYCITHADRKDQRMEYITEERIRSKLNEVSVNQIKKFNFDPPSEVVRLKTLNMIFKLNKYGEKSIFICLQFANLLTNEAGNSRKRYFNDSVIHRIKHRKLQLLLIIESIAYGKVSDDNMDLLQLRCSLYDFAVRCLLSEPHQPSVRYMLEWLIVRLILHYPSSFAEKFWNSFFEASEERMGSICSFISIAFHVCKTNANDLFLTEAVRSILPWAMGQHFNARLYAQTVLMKLINTNSSVKRKYEVIEACLNNCLKRGNAVKNAVKLQEDFYFCRFHPLNHFSMAMLLWDLPRLSGVCREEWLSKDLYNRYLVKLNDQMPLHHYPDIFSSLTSSTWIAKATSSFHDDTERAADEDVTHVNCVETQKKFIPVDSTSAVSTFKSFQNGGQLIVVSSLIDRAPNLGGLTRTCEVLGVSQLVLNNLDVIRNKEFTSLSITAEKHLDIVEVKKQNLYDYLLRLKEQDFLIVGAEQTTNSKNLRQFAFPLKSVIVLGNEREGIPASLLPALDVCVEIPQSGVIRSLNVHVSASLLIWEYAKQHPLAIN